VSVKELRRQAREALADKNLAGALGRFGDGYAVSREEIFRGRDFQALREEVGQIKGHAALRMGELADRFQAAAEGLGARVFRAATALDALAYIAGLAREHGVDLIVKSKSMASEEMHLNRYLGEQGLNVAETDLGEWIIQLSGQRPSHMVMPAIHLTREEVAAIFSRETGRTVHPDIPEMVELARRELRRKFLAAGLGVSGANVAVAETGTVVMVTNEGNGRLTTSLPPVHVVIVGLEKLVPRLADVAPILEVLPRSATAQPITSYVTMITGPVGAEGPDGRDYPRKELHIVLLDNGRTRMAADPVFREALRCVRCAACLNVCPVYQQVGALFGDVYTGGIGAVLTAFFTDPQRAGEIQNLCLDCGRCREVCSAGIDLPGLIQELRRRTVAGAGLPRTRKVFFEKVLTDRRLFHTLLRVASRAQKPFVRGGRIRHLPLFFAGLAQGRVLPPIAASPFRDLAASLPRPAVARGRVGFFAGCLIDFVYPGIGAAVQKVCTHLGLETVIPLGQTCCGFPAHHAGVPDVAAHLARQNIAAFGQAGVDTVVTACPTCAEALKVLYPRLLGEDREWGDRALALAGKVVDFASFAWAHRGKLRLEKEPWICAYHDSCHLKRGLGVSEEPRRLLAAAGASIAEAVGGGTCCGFGGSYALDLPEVSRAVLERRLQALTAAGAPVVALDCPGCLLQIAGGLEDSGSPVTVRHTAQIIAERLEPTQTM